MTDTDFRVTVPEDIPLTRNGEQKPAPAAGRKERPSWMVEPEPTVRQPNPIAKWIGDMRGDIDARKSRADGQWWFMRWMGEQPTSVADYVHFLAHERYERRDGRKGWGLRTEAALVDGGHALAYRVYGFLIGLPLTLTAYAFAWMAQRPGRGLLLLAAAWFVSSNLTIWLGGPQ